MRKEERKKRDWDEKRKVKNGKERRNCWKKEVEIKRKAVTFIVLNSLPGNSCQIFRYRNLR